MDLVATNAELARIDVAPYDQARVHFMLYSKRNRLLLKGKVVQAQAIGASLDEFQRHCGVRSFYRVRSSIGKRWVIELHAPDGRLLAHSPPIQTELLATTLLEVILLQSPSALRPGNQTA